MNATELRAKFDEVTWGEFVIVSSGDEQATGRMIMVLGPEDLRAPKTVLVLDQPNEQQIIFIEAENITSIEKSGHVQK